MQIAAEHDTPVLPRGAGTSQNDQDIGAALLIDSTRHLNQVLDELNRFLNPHGNMVHNVRSREALLADGSIDLIVMQQIRA